MKTEYITVDFDLKTNDDCDYLVQEFKKRDEVFQKLGNDPHYRWYIIVSLLQNESADRCIADFCKKLETYSEEAQNELRKIEKKEFLIGYRAGNDQPAFNDCLSHKTASAAAYYGIDIGICIYPASNDPEDYFNQNGSNQSGDDNSE